MAYRTLATSTTPALIIYLLDVSASMSTEMGDRRRIDVVTDALRAAFTQMTWRCTKGSQVSPRYHIALYAYSHHVWDLLDGVRPFTEVAELGVPDLSTMQSTDTAKAFEMAERLLTPNLDVYHACPAPLVCHLTDGEYTGDDPEPIAQRIKEMRVADGNVLVENIFISDEILPHRIEDPTEWGGIHPDTPLTNAYARKLRSMSSPLPESYRIEMAEMNYGMDEGAMMLLPGTSPELVAMGFQMAGVTEMG